MQYQIRDLVQPIARRGGPDDSSRLPMALYPTAAEAHVSEGVVADMFGLDVREVRAQNSFTLGLLRSRLIEAGYAKSGWEPKPGSYQSALHEISRAALGHWSKLLSAHEREERRHVQNVLRILRNQYSSTRT